MNTVIGCLLVLCILPLTCAWIAGYHRQKQLGNVDNKEPRTQSLKLTGAGARAARIAEMVELLRAGHKQRPRD